MRVVFWGTPDFALPSLRALLASDHEVIGVVTQPDRPAGRGRKLQAPPVKREIEGHDIPILQPEKPRGEPFLRQLSELDPEISVIAAYGQILPARVLELPRRGSINVHASLLPELRGAAPVNWAIIRGFRETGITIMRLVEALDAGPMIHQVRHRIADRATAGELTDELSELGADALLEALTLIETGEAVEEPQAEERASYAPKIGPDEARLDWEEPAVELDRWIRGCDPVPAAWTHLDDLRVRLFRPEVVDLEGKPGEVVRADPREGLRIATGEGGLEIGEVQPAGKRRMSASQWVQGRGVTTGQRFH